MNDDNDYEFEMHSAHMINPLYINSKWRVKLYHLNEVGNWDDIGTGYVSIHRELIDNKFEYTIRMHSELNGEILFEINLATWTTFNRQRGTIITWKSREEEDDDDSAVSFQEREGVREVWKIICALKGQDPQEELYTTEEFEEILQEPTIENLSFIANQLIPDVNPLRIMKIIKYVMSNNGVYIRRLGELLEQEEKKLEEKKSEVSKLTKSTDAESKVWSHFDHNLSLIFNIFKNLFCIGERNLIEFLMHDEFYLITFGALEYDFESQKIIKHRQYLKDVAKFKNVLNLTDPDLLCRIHLNHRLMYLKDTAIGRFIEEITMRHINMIILINNSEIIQFFLGNPHFIKQVIQIAAGNELERKLQGLKFILELIVCCRDLMQNKQAFYDTICELGLLDMLDKTLVEMTHYSDYNKYLRSLKEGNVIDNTTTEDNEQKETIKITALEILMNVLQTVPHSLKTYIISNNKDHTLLVELCNILIHQENFGIKYEIGELLKGLLDNEVLEKKNEFYELFYNKCLKTLVDFLEIPIKEEFRYEMISSKQIIIEIICHCMKQHGNRIRYWAVHHNLIQKVLSEEDKPKVIEVQVIKFLKSVLINNDEILNKVIILNDIFAAVIKIFNKNKESNNLVVSVILDLFQYICANTNSKKIVAYLFEKHFDFFYEESNKKMFSKLIEKYELGIDQFSGNIPDEAQKEVFTGYNVRELTEKENEEYFNDDDDEENKIFPMSKDDEDEKLLGKKRMADIADDILSEEEKLAIYEGFSKLKKRGEEEEEDFDNLIE